MSFVLVPGPGLLGMVTALLLLGPVSGNLQAANSAFANGEFTAAVRLYTSAIDADKNSALLFTKRAAAYINLRQLNQALRDLNKAVELDTGFVQGYLTRGKLHRQLCNFAAAERDFSKVLEIKPGQKAATSELEKTQGAASKFESLLSRLEGDTSLTLPAAKPLLDDLYSTAQDCAQVQLLEAQLLIRAGEHEQAVAVTGRVLKADDRNLAALVLRGNAYFYLHEHDLAKRHYGEALKYDPDHKEARAAFNKVKDYDKKRQRADRAAQEGDWQEAEKAYSEALHVDPEHRRGNVALWMGLCKARHHVGRYREAVEACKNVLVLDNNHAEAQQQVVHTLWELEEWQEAFNYAKQFYNQHQGEHAFVHLVREAEKKLKMSQRKDYYKILGVSRDAGSREIRKAYREAALKYHPDKVALDERPAAEERFREIAEAYEVLSDDEKRARYEAGEDVDQPQGHPGHHHGHPFNMGGMHFEFHFGG